MYRRFFNVNIGNAIKIFDAGGLKVTRAVPKNIINFFWPNCNLICKLTMDKTGTNYNLIHKIMMVDKQAVTVSYM